MKKHNHYLKTYMNTTTKNILSSKFIYDNVNDIPKIKNLRLTIESPEKKKLHYIATYILSNGFLPYIKKQYKQSNSRHTAVTKTNRFFFLLLKKYAIFPFFSLFFKDLCFGNINTENSPLYLTKNITKIVLWNVPLVEKTKNLQSEQGYLPNISLGLNFQFAKKNSLYEKIYFFRFLNFISFQEIDDLDKTPN